MDHQTKDENIQEFLESIDENTMMILIKIDKITGQTGIHFPDDISTEVIKAIAGAMISIANQVEENQEDTHEETEKEWN